MKENKKIYVWATDKLLTNAHPEHLTVKFIAICSTWKEAEAVEKWMENDGHFSCINHGYKKPYYRPGKFFEHIDDFKDIRMAQKYL